jgi:hypothetical protein
MLLIAGLAVALAGPPAGAFAGVPVGAPLVAEEGVRAAREWLAAREGRASFAVAWPDGRVAGHRPNRTYPSASVTKAMLLVAVLRAARERPLTQEERALLEPMITRSKNPPARALYARHGPGALTAVARRAGMARFAAAPSLFESRICAADQARLFLRIDRLMPVRHRGYARRLLGGLIPEHRWGIPEAAEARGLRWLAKGGWRSDVVHQAGQVRSGRARVGIAVLTADPEQNHGRNTVAGVARRVLQGSG